MGCTLYMCLAAMVPITGCVPADVLKVSVVYCFKGVPDVGLNALQRYSKEAAAEGCRALPLRTE
jgi:hypothetical protein